MILLTLKNICKNTQKDIIMQENVYFCRQIVTILILKGILTAYKHILSVIAVVLLLGACSAGQE